MWCSVVWYSRMWRSVVWQSVEWCGKVWCGIVQCGVVKCGVHMSSTTSGLMKTQKTTAGEEKDRQKTDNDYGKHQREKRSMKWCGKMKRKEIRSEVNSSTIFSIIYVALHDIARTYVPGIENRLEVQCTYDVHGISMLSG